MNSVELLRSKESLAVVFEKHRDRLHRMIECRLDPRVAVRLSAEDILQDSFVEASARLSEYVRDPNVPVFIWLRFLVGQQVQIAHRKHRSTNKRSVTKEVRNARLSTTSLLTELAQYMLASDTTPSMVISQQELNENIRNHVESLEEIDREILTLRHFEELTNAEAATELSISNSAASKRYHRALKKLRDSVLS